MNDVGILRLQVVGDLTSEVRDLTLEVGAGSQTGGVGAPKLPGDPPNLIPGYMLNEQKYRYKGQCGARIITSHSVGCFIRR